MPASTHNRIAHTVALALITLTWQKSAIAQGTVQPSISPRTQNVQPSISPQTQNMDALLDQSYSAMYNLQFADALRLAESAKNLATNDPVPWVTQACAVLFREFDRMHILRSELFGSDDRFSDGPAMVWDQPSRKQFEIALDGTEKLAQDRLKQSKEDPRALFARFHSASGLRADDAALIAKRS